MYENYKESLAEQKGEHFIKPNDFKEFISIELEMSGPGRSILSVKCRSKIEAPNATAPRHV
jgi:hypothetical protein